MSKIFTAVAITLLLAGACSGLVGFIGAVLLVFVLAMIVG